MTIGNFAFVPPMLQVKAGTTVTWVNRDDIPHSIVCPPLQRALASDGYRRVVQLHVRQAGRVQLSLRPASVHAWPGGGVGLSTAVGETRVTRWSLCYSAARGAAAIVGPDERSPACQAGGLLSAPRAAQ